MGELAKQKISACSLPMPNPNDPVVSEWVKVIEFSVGHPSDEVILLGHSLGAPAVLHYLKSLPSGLSVGGVLLVSGFSEPLENKNNQIDLDKINSFVTPPINLTDIKSHSKKIVVIHGSDDTVVPFSYAEKMSRELECKLVRVAGGSHFSQISEPVCYKLPEALHALEEIIG